MGYAPGSVYKVQRQFRRSGNGVAKVGQAPIPASAPDEETEDSWEFLLRHWSEGESLQNSDATSLAGDEIETLKEKTRGISNEVQRSEVKSDIAEEQISRIGPLEFLVSSLNEVTLLMGQLLYHLDIHHRQVWHGQAIDRADSDVRLGDEGYRSAQRRLQELLAEAALIRDTVSGNIEI